MFKTSQNFTFTISQNDHKYDFTGQLVFKSKVINSIGTLHTEEELSSFGILLNESLPIPEYWTLELLAQHIFNYARSVFSNLFSVNLYLTQSPQRIAEYIKDYSEIDGDVLELEAVD